MILLKKDGHISVQKPNAQTLPNPNASLCQVAFMGVWPNALCICGAALVMGSVVGIAIEEKYISDGSDDEDDVNGRDGGGEGDSAATRSRPTIARVRRDSDLTYP